MFDELRQGVFKDQPKETSKASDLFYEHSAICAEIAVKFYELQRLNKRQREFRDDHGKRVFDTPIDYTSRAESFADQSLVSWGWGYHREFFFEKWGDKEALAKLSSEC